MLRGLLVLGFGCLDLGRRDTGQLGGVAHLHDVGQGDEGCYPIRGSGCVRVRVSVRVRVMGLGRSKGR